MPFVSVLRKLQAKQKPFPWAAPLESRANISVSQFPRHGESWGLFPNCATLSMGEGLQQVGAANFPTGVDAACYLLTWGAGAS